jgi:formylglycine-generating enzyme required for sulfatase activity
MAGPSTWYGGFLQRGNGAAREASAARRGLRIELPSAGQWEMAARGPDGRRFPWGNGLERERAPSPWGAEDMVGVIGQWTCTETESGEPLVCGDPAHLRCAGRVAARPDSPGVGFRVCVSIS